MSSGNMTDALNLGVPRQEQELPRWVQIPAGLVLGLLTLLCVCGSLVLLFGLNGKNPILATVLGFVLLLGCLWVLEKCLRLVTGRKIRGGLLSPNALRVVSYYFLILPVVGLFNGYYRRMGVVTILQGLMFVFAFLGLRTFARRREAAYDSTRPTESDLHPRNDT